MLKKVTRASLILLFILALILPFAQTASAADNEIISLRTENSKTFDLGNSQHRVEIYGAPIHYKDNYKDSLEQWKDIDLTFVNNQISKAPYLLSVSPDSYSLTMYDKKTGSSASLALSTIDSKAVKVVKPDKDTKGKIIFKDVATDLDIEIVASTHFVQFKRILKSDKAPTDAIFGIAQSGTGITITSNARYTNMGVDDVKVSVTTSINNNLLIETIDKSKILKYPIEIDPTLDIQPSAKDAGILQDYPTTNFGAEVWLGVWDATASRTRRSIVEFSLAGLPAGATLTSASLQLYYYTNSTDPKGRSVWAYKLTRTDWVEAQATWNIYKTSCNWTAAGGDYVTTAPVGDNTTFPTSFGWMYWNNVLPIVQDAYGASNPAEFEVKYLTEVLASPAWGVWYSKNEATETTKRPKLSIVYVTFPSVSTVAADTIEDTTANLKGNIDNLNGGANCTVRGFGWDIHTHVNWNDYANQGEHTHGDYGVGAFNINTGTFPTGTTIYYRAYATNPSGTGQGAEMTFLTKPAAPTAVSATDGTDTAKVVITWTKSTGATDYEIYRDGADLAGIGDFATYNDNAAAPPTITGGTASASDGTSPLHVVLSIAGESSNHGSTHSYLVVARNATGDSDNSTSDTGFRDAGALSYDWFRTTADADDIIDYASIAGEGGTTDPYNDVNAPAPTITPGAASASDGTFPGYSKLEVVGESVTIGNGRWYLCNLSAVDAASENTTHNRGYRGVSAITYQWQRTATDNVTGAYGNIAGATTDIYDDYGCAFAPDGRYYQCVLNSIGAAQQTTTTDRGYGGVGAPTNFTLTYINDYQIDITWTLGAGAANTMIRRRYGDFPSDNTSGDLIYIGSGTGYNDINVDITSSQMAYYWAWSQSAGGIWEWVGVGKEANFMSISFFFLGLLFLSLALTTLTFIFRFAILSILSAGSWAGLLVFTYYQTDMIGREVMLIVFIGAVFTMLASLAFLRPKKIIEPIMPYDHVKSIDDQLAYYRNIRSRGKRKRINTRIEP